jgi:aryl-alcohol dehydrogenase-like predicted oxidoreductase
MRLRVLGRSGLRVSELCLGAMTFGTDWGWGAEEDECRAIYSTFREAGGNFVDTANMYTQGASEEIVGRLVADERDAVVVATKFTLPTSTHANSSGSHRKNLRHSVETSLRRLASDYIDVLWVHAWDECTPAEETLRALDDLVRAGKVLAIGVSNTPAWLVARSDAIAELRGWSAFCALQVEYSLAARSAEREFFPMAEALGLPMLAWSPLANGILTGKFSASDSSGLDSLRAKNGRQLTAIQQQAVDAVAKVAAELGTTPAPAAIAWVVQRGLIPVLGARTLTQLQDNLGALDVHFDDEQLETLDGATRIRLGYPYDFLNERRAWISGGILEDR